MKNCEFVLTNIYLANGIKQGYGKKVKHLKLQNWFAALFCLSVHFFLWR